MVAAFWGVMSKENGWQPIATMPDDGKVYLVFAPHASAILSGFSFVGLINLRSKIVPMMGDNEDYTNLATHWMELPDHPTSKPNELLDAASVAVMNTPHHRAARTNRSR